MRPASSTPMPARHRRRCLAAAILGVALVASACTAQAASDDPELEVPSVEVPTPRTEDATVIEEIPDLDGVEIWVGSEEGSTYEVLGYVLIETLEAAGATAVDRVGLGSGLLTRESLLAGEIDAAWQPMGTAWTAYLREPDVPADVDTLHAELASRDLEESGVAWLSPARFSDERGLAVSEVGGEFLDVSTISRLGELVDDGMPVTLCVTADFLTFPAEGRVDVEEALDESLGDDIVRQLDPEPIYPATADGSCTFGQVRRVDGRVARYELRLLDDDVDVFSRNNPAVTMREDLVASHPDLVEVLTPVAGALDVSAMQRLNEAVELDGEDPRAVARGFLVEHGFIGE